MPKISDLGKSIIGIDELHNGFHFNKSLPMLIVAYLEKNYSHSQPANEKYERKKGALNPEGMPFPKLLERAQEYISEHPDFLYLTVNYEHLIKNPAMTRVQALSLLVSSMFDQYNLAEKNTIIYCHKMDTKSFTDDVLFRLRENLKHQDIHPLKIDSKQEGDKFSPIKRADRLAYYLFALRFRGYKNWPHRNNRVHLNLPKIHTLDDIDI